METIHLPTMRPQVVSKDTQKAADVSQMRLPKLGEAEAERAIVNVSKMVALTEGYKAHPPTTLPLSEITADAADCHRASCRLCGRKGLAYRPFSRLGHYGTLYHIFAVCTRCGTAEEW